MKRSMLFCVALVVCSMAVCEGLAFAEAYEDVILFDTPVGYWRLGDAPGSITAADVSAGGNPGTYGPNTLLGRPGALGENCDTAILSDGNQQSTVDGIEVDAGNVHNFSDRSSFSIEAWVSRQDFAGSDEINPIVSKVGPGRYNGYLLNIGQTGRLNFYVMNSFPESWARVESITGNNLNNSDWHHVVVTYNGPLVWQSGTPNVADGIKLYIDGVAANRTVLRNTLDTPVATTMENDGSFYIGRYNGSSPVFFNGMLDEVAVYDRVLLPGEITAHHNAAIESRTLACLVTPTDEMTIAELQEEIASLEAELDICQSEVTDLNSQIGGIQETLNSCRADNSSLTTSLTDCRNTVSTLTETVSRLTAENNLCNIRATELQTQIDDLNDELGSATGRIGELETELSSCQSERDSLSTDLDACRSLLGQGGVSRRLYTLPEAYDSRRTAQVINALYDLGKGTGNWYYPDSYAMIDVIAHLDAIGLYNPTRAANLLIDVSRELPPRTRPEEIKMYDIFGNESDLTTASRTWRDILNSAYTTQLSANPSRISVRTFERWVRRAARGVHDALKGIEDIWTGYDAEERAYKRCLDNQRWRRSTARCYPAGTEVYDETLYR